MMHKPGVMIVRRMVQLERRAENVAKDDEYGWVDWLILVIIPKRDEAGCYPGCLLRAGQVKEIGSAK